MRMLHLTDLHFGSDRDKTSETQRMILLDRLLKLPELETVDVVLVTGDVVWRCSEEGYTQATKWFKKLFNTVKKDAKFIGCCGNHDVDQTKCKELQYISAAEKIRETLRPEELPNLQRRFEKYIAFCEENHFEQLTLNDTKNYLVGSIDMTVGDMNLRFCVFNSAWYALKGGENDRGHLWIGRNFYDMLDMEGTGEEQTYVITVMHHPKEWLNENETQTEGDNQNKSLFELISADSHLCFTGHTHGNIQTPNFYHNHMLTFSSGATYAETTYRHNFSFYDLDKEKNTITRIPYESVDQKKWKRCETSDFSIDVQKGTDVCVIGNTTEKTETEDTINANGWNRSQSTRFCETLEEIGAQLIRVSNHDFSVNKTVIWPVVPRNTLTTIHLAQLELMAILCRDFGWSVNAIISNCGSHPQNEEQVSAFEQKIHKYCRYVGIEKFDCSYLDSYFKPEHVFAADVLGNFIRFSSQTNVPELSKIKIKRYASDKQQQILQEAVLDYILPLLQMAVVKTVAHQLKVQSGQKPIVLAGEDEHMQWDHVVRTIGGDDIGAILIPELSAGKQKDTSQIDQDSTDESLKKIIQCLSKSDLQDSFKVGNAANWFYKMFVVMPNYYAFEKIAQANIFRGDRPQDLIEFWSTASSIPDCINLKKLLDYVWGKLEKGTID